MIQTKNKLLIAAYIDKNKEEIIEKYEQNMPINLIAELYGVSRSIIYSRLVKWGITLRKYKGARRRKEERLMARKHYKRQFTDEFLVIQKENTAINDKKIKYVEFKETTEDQILVRNIIRHPLFY